jgi:SAM-dependent methyltransferase
MIKSLKPEPEQINHWVEFARLWDYMTPPFRPSEEDVEVFKSHLNNWVKNYGSPRVLLLGVTPEIYHLPWPKGTDFLAVDHNPAMIERVWPGPKEKVLCCNWLNLKLPEGSRDIIFCDGGLHLLAYPKEQKQLVRIIRKFISPCGIVIFRLFVLPSIPESPFTLAREFMEGKIFNLNLFRLRLAMSFQNNSTRGVELIKVGEFIDEFFPDLEGLAKKVGWSSADLDLLRIYRNSKNRYHFLTLKQSLDLFCGPTGNFEMQNLYFPTYEWGKQFPIIVFRRRL